MRAAAAKRGGLVLNQTLVIGPLALPYALLVTLLAIALGWFSAKRLGRSAGTDMEPLLLRMLLIGVLGARLAFIWQWWGAYFGAPLSLFDIRDGGWDAGAGLVAAGLYALYRARSQRALRKPAVAAVLVTMGVWVSGSLAIWMNASDAPPLPQLSLASLEGPSVALAGFAGKPTVINLWASWCPPCRREMPVLRQAQLDSPDVNFVFVNQGETPETIVRYLNQQDLKLGNVLVDARSQAGLALGQRALPTTLFFDAHGRLVSTRMGELSPATLAQRLGDARTSTPSTEHSLSQ